MPNYKYAIVDSSKRSDWGGLTPDSIVGAVEAPNRKAATEAYGDGHSAVLESQLQGKDQGKLREKLEELKGN
jgi:hypothetical protein